MGNACLSGAVNAPKRGEWPRHPKQKTCLQCGEALWIPYRGDHTKKFCNNSCATHYNMALRHGRLYARQGAIEPCLTCHDAMRMKSEMSAALAGVTRRAVLTRRKENGFDSMKVSSMASRAFHASNGTLICEEEKTRRTQEQAWGGEWRGVTDCHYAQYWHDHWATGVRRRALWRKRYKTDPAFTCKRMLRNQVARIKRRTTWSKRSNELLGCTYEYARKHIESKFKRGMSWSNVGEWEIDHIIPISAFDLTNEQQVRSVNHFTNLQPLWKEENRLKRDRFPDAHQLALL